MKKAFIIIGGTGWAGLVMNACIDLEPLPASGSGSDGDDAMGATETEATETEGGCKGAGP